MEPTYAARWMYAFPWWYTLYSILPGRIETACDAPLILDDSGASRKTTIASCLPGPAVPLPDTAAVADKTADAVEAAFRGKVRITRLTIRLVPPGTKVFERDSTLLRPQHLALRLVAAFDPGDQDASHRRLVRSLAHELLHMGKRALGPWHAAMGSTPPEEVAAALFESCVEEDVFGSLSPSAANLAQQADPERLAGSADAYRSAAGNLQAAAQLGHIAGADGIISSEVERDRLQALCTSLAP